MTSTVAPELSAPVGPPSGLPIGPAFDSELASWARRLVAMLLDSSVLGFGIFLLAGDVGTPLPVPLFTTEGLDPAPRAGTWPWAGVVALVVTFMLLQAYAGSTPGKAAVGIAVVDDRSGRPVGQVRTIGRWVAHFFDAILCIGYLRPLWHPERRTFADSWAQTVVVHRRTWRATPARLAAFAVCVIGVAASITTSMGIRTVGSTSVSCTGPDGATKAVVTRDEVESWGSRLWVIRRDSPSEPQPVTIDLEGLTAGTERLLVTTGPFGASPDDLRDVRGSRTWIVDLAEFPEVMIEPAVAPDALDRSNDAGDLLAFIPGDDLSHPWSLEIAPTAVEQQTPGIDVQIVMDAAAGEALLCSAGLGAPSADGSLPS